MQYKQWCWTSRKTDIYIINWDLKEAGLVNQPSTYRLTPFALPITVAPRFDAIAKSDWLICFRVRILRIVRPQELNQDKPIESLKFLKSLWSNVILKTPINHKSDFFSVKRHKRWCDRRTKNIRRHLTRVVLISMDIRSLPAPWRSIGLSFFSCHTLTS